MPESDLPSAPPVQVNTEYAEKEKLSVLSDLLTQVGQYWNTGLDFRLKLLVILVVCLSVNILLLRCVWRKYGDRVADMLMKQGQYHVHKIGAKIRTFKFHKQQKWAWHFVKKIYIQDSRFKTVMIYLTD